VKWGQAHHSLIDAADGALVLWAQIFGAQTGDRLHFLITGPQGVFLDHIEGLDTTQARAMRATGRRLHDENTQAGGYQGVATLIRDGREIDRVTSETTLTAP
jgi:hypothetical protein